MKNLLVVMMFAIPAVAQNAIQDALVKHWKVSADFTIAVAKLMPADSWGFKPVPAELSFAQLMIQVAGANLNACSAASGMARPTIPADILQAVRDEKDVEKDKAIQFLGDSFGFCEKAVATLTPDKLTAVVGPSGRKMTAFEWQWAYFTHTAHHRGQAEVYLRLKGITPPEYVF